MTKDITVKDEELIDENKIVEYMRTSGIGTALNDNEKRQFIEVAKAYQLNPFKREIYCIPYGKDDKRRLSIITGYEVYLKRAERTGKLDGWSVEIAGSRKDSSLKAIVTIYRKDWAHPFVHEAYWAEYKQNNSMWDTKPITMIKKVVIAQAFRMCFPDEFGGMPYTSDELPDEMTQQRDVSPEQPEVPDDATPEKETPPTRKADNGKTKTAESPPDTEGLEEFTTLLDDAVLDGLIGKNDRDFVLNIAKKAHGVPREKYIGKVGEHLKQLREEKSVQEIEDPELVETPETPEIY